MNGTSLQLRQLIDGTPACAGKTHAEITTILNTPVADALVQPDLTRRKTLRVLAGRGIISKIYDGARDINNTHQIRSICFAVEAVVNAGAEGIDTADPGNTQMMAALKAANIVSQADIDALNAAAKSAASPAMVAGLGTVTVDDVRNAMTSF